MTTIWLLLGGILVIGIALALELLRLSRAPQAFHSASLWQELSDPSVYRPMARLFSEQDLEFVASRQANRSSLRRLRRARCEVMALYVRQMRRDFHHIWSLCRLLAPVSHDSELSVLLIRQFVIFHVLCLVLQLRCLAGRYGRSGFEIAGLVGVLNHLRRCANGALRNSEALAIQTAGTRAA
jgi:hypothetical protein